MLHTRIKEWIVKHAILIIVGLTVLFTGTANALMTTTFDDVQAEVESRLAALPTEDLTKDEKKESKSLAKVLKTFAKESTSTKQDVKLIGKIVKTLFKQYPEDEAMATLLGDAIAAFHDEFYAGKTDADRGYGVLQETNKKKKSATKSKEKVEGLDMMFDDAEELLDRTKYLKKVETGLTKYDKATSKALLKEELTAHQEHFLLTLENGYTGAANCLQCHADAGTHMLESGHWKWEAMTPNVVGDDGALHGKKDIINNFCIAIPSNEGRCTQCHPGYGYKDDTFDFNNLDNLDCLVCHDTTGAYKKDPKKAGAPVAGTDLTSVAMNVGEPGRANCGSCHFYAGGGDNVKKGDLGSALVAADITEATDVHMGGMGFSCQKCHETVEHKIPGNQIQNSGRVSCEGCHDTGDLSASYHTTGHLSKMACQTCHIPAFSRQQPTKVHWDWSTAGQDVDPTGGATEFGQPLYNKMKGTFSWDQNVAPSLMWYNGTWSKTFIGVNDKADPSKLDEVFVLGAPQGASDNGKIYPFKKMTGFQPVDVANGTILVPHLFPSGPDDTTAYWKGYDWNAALTAGAAAAGQTYTGGFDWIETVQYLAINHEVAPKESARTCGSCHGASATFPWAELMLTDPTMPK